MSLCVVTATTNLDRAQDCLNSWGDVPVLVVCNGGATPEPAALPANVQIAYLGMSGEYFGTVPAFRIGTDLALKTSHDIIANLHDDFRIDDPDWVKKVETHFKRFPACGLAGFGGAIGLGAEDIYQTPYDPMQLARVGFRSNLVDAEAHGIRSLLPERVACLDGFSQVGRREFWEGQYPVSTSYNEVALPIWQQMEQLGVRHHLYDGLLGCYAKRLGWEVWYLPIAGKHFGGRTAVGDAGYQHWAHTQIEGGDGGFWQKSHEIGYDQFRDVLPIRG